MSVSKCQEIYCCAGKGNVKFIIISFPILCLYLCHHFMSNFISNYISFVVSGTDNKGFAKGIFSINAGCKRRQESGNRARFSLCLEIGIKFGREFSEINFA